MASLRNGDEAVELAQRANRRCDGKRPDVLDTLAASYAELGQFPGSSGHCGTRPWNLSRNKTRVLWRMPCGLGSPCTKRENPIMSRYRLPHRRNLDCLHPPPLFRIDPEVMEDGIHPFLAEGGGDESDEVGTEKPRRRTAACGKLTGQPQIPQRIRGCQKTWPRTARAMR